ncbi:hypothetical protein CJ20_177 [Escherichia phage CJ20]|nr:hypothetical protein CJ20_177 [Escherichia phage CJ20]
MSLVVASFFSRVSTLVCTPKAAALRAPSCPYLVVAAVKQSPLRIHSIRFWLASGTPSTNGRFTNSNLLIIFIPYLTLIIKRIDMDHGRLSLPIRPSLFNVVRESRLPSPSTS